MNTESRETRLSAAFVKLADTLAVDFDVVDLLQTLIDICADLLDTEAGGLMLSDAAGELQLVASTSESADLVEVMQLAAGAGPCVDCFVSGQPVTVSDLGESDDRWPAFRAEALKQGFRSVQATPMRLRGQVIGTMNLFSTTAGGLNPQDVILAQALADVATIGILQERNIRESGDVRRQLQHALNSRLLIEQAKGVLSQQANLDMTEAFLALRSYARNNNLTLSAVATRVIDRSLDLFLTQS